MSLSQQPSPKPQSVREMTILNEWPVSDDIRIVQVKQFSEPDYKALVHDTLGAMHPFLNWQGALDDRARAKTKELGAYLKEDLQLRLAILQGEDLIGASYSFQLNASDMMMAISTVRPDFRGRGLYSALAKRVLAITTEAGFQSVLSKHLMTNNPILIAKLKLGFKICGLETHAVYGTLLNMVFHHSELMAKALRYRSGELHLFSEEDIVEHFGSPMG